MNFIWIKSKRDMLRCYVDLGGYYKDNNFHYVEKSAYRLESSLKPFSKKCNTRWCILLYITIYKYQNDKENQIKNCTLYLMLILKL